MRTRIGLLVALVVISSGAISTRRRRTSPEPPRIDGGRRRLELDGGTARPQRPRRRSKRRRLGKVLVVLGVLVLAYAATVVLWRDPATDLYARWKQNELSDALEETFASYEASVATSAAAAPTVTDVPTERERLEAAQLAVARAANELHAQLKKGKPLGRIHVPKIGLDAVFVHGTRWGPDLSQGPGHYPQTSLPGVGRTMAIAGHRTTFGAPFRHIDSLKPGNLIELELPYATFRYRVFRHRIVDNGDWSIIRDRGFDTLVLSACHPLYSADQRWIVFGRLVSVQPVGGQGYRFTGDGELARM